MNKLLSSLAILGLLGAGPVSAQTLEVWVDRAYGAALQDIIPRFTERTGFDVNLTADESPILTERICAGEPADLFFPASESYMQQAMGLGLLDVALRRNILQLPPDEVPEDEAPADPQYAPAAVLSQAEHRLAAMAFLEFLASDEVRGIFVRQGFLLP